MGTSSRWWLPGSYMWLLCRRYAPRPPLLHDTCQRHTQNGLTGYQGRSIGQSEPVLQMQHHVALKSD